MPVDAFILFVPANATMLAVEGESLDAYFGPKSAEGGKQGKNKWFEIKEFSLGIENKSTIGSATGGAGAGKVQFNEFTIKKNVDLASPAFFKNCCAGAHYKAVQIACRKSGTDGAKAGGPYLLFNFGTVFTTKVEWSGPGDEAPEENITFAYGALQLEYHKQDDTGALVEKRTVDWTQMLNKEGFADGKGGSIKLVDLT